MKTIGLIGGMTWDSTEIYYHLINRAVQQRLGGVHSASIAMISFDFATPEAMARTSDWDGLAALISDAGLKLKQAGAAFLVVCANTAHRVAEQVERDAGLPLVHICDCTAAAVAARGFKRVLLLGTRYTMEEDFFRDRLRDNGLDVVIPDRDGRDSVHRAIEEVWKSYACSADARLACRALIAQHIADGVEAVILGCTELPHVVTGEDCAVPLFDTTELHALAAVERALA